MDPPRPPPMLPALPPRTDGLYTASNYLFVPSLREFEQVAQDEVDDGLASAADTQAQLWVEAARDGKNIFSDDHATNDHHVQIQKQQRRWTSTFSMNFSACQQFWNANSV